MSFSFLGGRFGGTEQQNLLLCLSPCVFYALYTCQESAKVNIFFELYIHVAVLLLLLHRNTFLFNNQPDALINQIYCHKILHVSGIFSAHHQEFSTVHSALVSFRCSRVRMELLFSSILTVLGSVQQKPA
jgi:hypothetical protein